MLTVTDDATLNVGRVAARGAGVVAAGQATKFLIQLAGLAVLARLLEPAAFGLMAMTVAIVGVGEVLRDFGLSSAAIQAKTISHGQRSNLFWINAGIGLVLMLVLFFAADWIASLYGDATVAGIARALSPVFLLSALATQFRADLTRRLRFGALALTDVSAQFGGLVCAVIVALVGGDYWALVAQQLTQAALVLAFLAVQGRWVPAWPSRREEMGGLLRFGWNVVGTQLLGYASRNVDSFIIGRQFGATSLGLYNRAFQLLMLPLTQINAPATTVALPILSRQQSDSARFAALIVKCQTVLLHAVFAAIAFSFALAPVAVALVLGEAWSGSVPIFRILCLAGAFQAASYVTYWAFVSLGRTGSHLRFTLATRPALIVLIVIGANWGMPGVAWAYGIGLALMWPFGVWWLRKDPAVPVRRLILGCLGPLGVYAIAGATGAVVERVFDGYGPVVSIPAGAGAVAFVVGLGCLFSRRFRGGLDATRQFVARAVRARG